MPDRKIPFYHMILRCDREEAAAPVLQKGCELRMYQKGEARKWARLEYEIRDFASEEEAERYFITTYRGKT